MRKNLLFLAFLISLAIILAGCEVKKDLEGMDGVSGGAPAAAKCIDSDGRNYFVQGTASYAGQTYTDYCDVNGNLIEYFCHPRYVRSESKSCASLGNYVCENGACVTAQGPFCGDKSCDLNEDCNTCATDCGVCPPAGPTCGNNACESGETCSSCQLDCGSCPSAPSTADITVASNVPIGKTPKYTGVTEGANFRIEDIKGLGANAFRYWLGPERIFTTGAPFEDGKYPTRSYIKSLLQNWPENKAILEQTIKTNLADQGFNKDYWWQDPADKGGATLKYQFDQLKSNGITPTISVRPYEEGTGNPSWMSRPPFGDNENAKDEYWYYVFSVFYWMNIYKSYGINIMHVDNEPSRKYKWTGAANDYAKDVLALSYDAAKTANDLVGLNTITMAAVDVADAAGWQFLEASVNNENTYNYKVDVADYHNYMRYNSDKKAANDAFVKGKERVLLLSEWGTYEDVSGYKYSVFDISNSDPAKWQDMPLKVARTIFDLSKLQCLDSPACNQKKYLLGSEIFLIEAPWGGFKQGLVIGGTSSATTKTPTYHAFHLETRCLQGARDFFELASNDMALKDLVLVTKEGSTVYINSVNYIQGTKTADKTFTIDISALGKTSGTVGVYEFSSANYDKLVESKSFSSGLIQLAVPAQGAVCAVVN